MTYRTVVKMLLRLLHRTTVIRRLRLKVEDDPQTPGCITTVWGFGYKWGF